jgi:hypothetical protein
MSLVYRDESEETIDVRIPIPSTSITSTSSSSPTTIFGIADPNFTKAKMTKLFISNTDTVTHIVILGQFNMATSTFIPYLQLVVDANGGTVMIDEKYLPGFYSEGPVVIAAYLTSAPSTGTFVTVSGEVQLLQ